MRRLSLCLSLCLLHGLSGPVAAQAPPLPGWVVPVLRLVSSTHVEPTTGVVLSADGLVLVPADFASPGDEVVVLDGGRDIVRHGRPARLEMAFSDLGLEVLRVEGLRREGAPVATAPPLDGDGVTLRAFPPAEQIAEGAAPLNLRATIAVLGGGATAVIAADTPLPNVTGPLVDDCGNLLGLSLAAGVQALSPSADTQYRWPDALRSVLEELQLPVRGSTCHSVTAGPKLSPPAPDAGGASTPAGEAAEPDGVAPGDVEARAVAEQAPSDGGTTGPSIEELPPFEHDAIGTEPVASADSGRVPPPSRWWLAAALLMLLAGGALRLLRRRGRRGAGALETGPGPDGQGADPAALEPDEPDPRRSDTPGGCRLVLRGRLADGRPVTASTAVAANAIDVEIGRGTADLVIDSASVSRRHARLAGTAAALTLGDLGSSNGTSINGIPCLEGEVMYLEPGDTVLLGDVEFTVVIEDLPVRSDTE